jgi:7-cyano-7-deazaguanine synthase
MTNEERKINILWTGGLDSTFRVVELSRRQCTIQPYYVTIGKSKSFYHELKAIDKITRILRKDSRTRAKLLDPIIVSEQDIPRDGTLFDSWFRLMRAMSWQYYIFAKLANQQHLEMEMGIQFSQNGTVAKSIDETLLIPHPDKDYDVLVIDKTRADQDTINIFGSFCFPKSLYHKDKREEVDVLHRDGYEKVVKHVWFCFHPIWGFPCGHCAPCISSEKEGVKIPSIGKMLYNICHLFKKKKHRRVIKLNYDYDIQKVSDLYVAQAIDPETGEVKKAFRLNETGVIILEALQDGTDIDEIARRLTDGFDVDYETAKTQASAFIAKLNL